MTTSTPQCRVCQVLLEGARELDEGRGDICLRCLPYDAIEPLCRQIDELKAEVFKLKMEQDRLRA